MKTIGLTEARRTLSRLIDEAEAGETVVLTRHGHPVARLGPAEASKPDRKAAVRALQEFAEWHQIRLAGITINELIEEGRRW